MVGSRGMSGARRFLLGSVPNRIAHHATCDVLVVKTDAVGWSAPGGGSAGSSPVA